MDLPRGRLGTLGDKEARSSQLADNVAAAPTAFKTDTFSAEVTTSTTPQADDPSRHPQLPFPAAGRPAGLNFRSAELLRRLTEFTLSYAEAALVPVAPPETTEYDSSGSASPVAGETPPAVVAEEALAQWMRKATQRHAVASGDITAMAAGDPLGRELDDPPWTQELLRQVAKDPQLRFPWFRLKVFLSYILIRRLVTRFYEHLYDCYINLSRGGDSGNKFRGDTGCLRNGPVYKWRRSIVSTESQTLLYIQRKAKGANLPPAETPTIAGHYQRDITCFLEQRRFLVWQLRAYKFPPFTLRRLCELLDVPRHISQWPHEFWKWCFAIQKCLKGIGSSMSVVKDSSWPPISKSIGRRIRREVWRMDTPLSLNGFIFGRRRRYSSESEPFLTPVRFLPRPLDESIGISSRPGSSTTGPIAGVSLPSNPASASAGGSEKASGDLALVGNATSGLMRQLLRVSPPSPGGVVEAPANAGPVDADGEVSSKFAQALKGLLADEPEGIAEMPPAVVDSPRLSSTLPDAVPATPTPAAGTAGEGYVDMFSDNSSLADSCTAMQI